jgi:hypothetical protein
MFASLTPIAITHRNADADRISKAVLSLAKLLREQREFVATLTDAEYARKPAGVISGSVGGNIRRCLDHVRALLYAVEFGNFDYDPRKRGTPVESSRCCAMAEIDELLSELRSMPREGADRMLSMSVLVSGDLPAIIVQTSVSSELTYVVSHTIHHNALIGALVRALGENLPERS